MATIFLTFITNMTVLATTIAEGSPWWVSFIVSCVSPFLFFALNLLGKIILRKLEERGFLSKEDTDKALKDLEDLTDDGKINGSTSKKEDNEDEK